MFKSIFSKLVTVFLLILAIAFSVTGVMLNFFLDRFFTSETKDTLVKSCDYSYEVFTRYIENRDSPIASVYLSDFLSTLSRSLYSYIWIVDETGHIGYTSPNLPDVIVNKYKDDTGLMKLPDNGEFSKLINSKGSYSEIGHFNGFFKDPYFINTVNTGDMWLTVAKSYEYAYDSSNSVKLAIYIHTPVPRLKDVRNSVLGFFLTSVGVAVFIAVILVYLVSLRLSRPLKQINNAARIIAGGDFRKRLNIKSNDEIGELAGTFNQMAVALQNLEEMRRGFIANVSHELRTPMTSIRGFIEGILDGTIPPDRQEYYLSIVRDETNRLNRLVNDLLDLARMEAGEIVLNLKPFDINELVRRCVIKLETLLLNKSIYVEADFEEEGMLVNADADAIERVLYNLVHNAIKFTPEKGRIKITTKAQKDKVFVSVKDNGIGIDREELDMIWERFYKTDKSRSRDKTGTGLGLAIVKNIINEHGQQIWVESEPGRGTEFIFTLEGSGNAGGEENKRAQS
jgi:signal transduction histidine kinase